MCIEEILQHYRASLLSRLSQVSADWTQIDRDIDRQDAQVTPLMSKDLPDVPGKEGLMITVVYPPGASDPIHRHNAHAFVYVLEGSIVMQVKDGKEVILTPGQTFMKVPIIFI
jgi:quercetin dioxygenase-like cupin family protein